MSTPVNHRSLVLLVLFSLVGLTFLSQLARLTILEREALVSQIPSSRVAQFTVDAPRGDIYDRSGRPLAINRPASVVYIRYPHYTDPEVRRLLARVLSLSEEELALTARRREEQGPIWEPLRVKSDISPDEYARLLENQAGLPGVTVQVEAVRQYPQGVHAAHIVGYVGAIGEGEWDRLRRRGYQPDDMIGKTGLESYYEQWLRGTPGVSQVEVDPRARPLGTPRRLVDPVQGHRLNLTLNLELQKAAERALEWTVFRINAIGEHRHRAGGAPEIHPARAGALVVLDVRTGAVLAMASHPTYDPNLFITRRPYEEFQRIITDSVGAPLWNRAIRANYVPGSAWKMLVGAAALAEGQVTPHERFHCTGHYTPTNQGEPSAGHGHIHLETAIQHSCNIYFYELGSRVGIARMEQYAREFGFGVLTGIDLPDESAGFIPDAAWRQQHGWYLGDTTSAAIGQKFEVTPLQMARYVAAIASGGQVMKPYLVQSVIAPDGRVAWETQPTTVSRLSVPQAALDAIIQGMKAVDGPAGTSGFAQYPLAGITTAGKTGTAQVEGKSDYGIYVGFAPADAPEIAVAIMIEEGGHGAWVAPAARAVYSAYFGIPLQPGDPAYIPPDFPANREEIARVLDRTDGTYISPGTQP